MGYEPYVPDEALPTIDFGQGVSRVTDDMIDVSVPPANRPESIPARTADLNPQQQEVFVRESNRLIDEGFGPREAQNRALALATNDIRGAEMVPEPRFRDVSNSVQGEAITSAPTRQTEEIVTSVEARQAATDRVVPDQIQVEPVEVPMPVEVQKAMLPVGSGERKYSRLALDLIEDGERLRRVSPDRAERMGVATYQQANMDAQYRMGAELVENNLDLAMRIARQEATVPGLLDNAVVMALSRFARNTNNPKLAIEAARAIRQSSLKATRFGQELRVLQREGGRLDDPVEIMAEVLNQRAKRIGSGAGTLTDKQKMANFEAKKRKLVDGAKRTLGTAQMKMAEAQKVIDDIIC